MRHNIGRQKRFQRNRSVSESSSWERNPRRRQFSIGSVPPSLHMERKRADSIGNDLNPITATNNLKSEFFLNLYSAIWVSYRLVHSEYKCFDVC